MKSLLPLLLLVAIFCTSCYQDIEACLDPLAKNYDLSTDVECKACCLFPNLSIGITHTYGTENYSVNKAFVGTFADTFTITEQAMYFSGIEFIDADGVSLTNLTSKEFTVSGEKKDFESNYCLLRSTPIECVSGSAKFAGEIKKINFTLGLETDLTKIDSISAATDKNLSRREVLYVENKYRSAYFKIKTQSGIIKTIYLDQNIPISLSSPTPFTNKSGQTIQYKIKMEYAILFEGIDFEHSENTVIQSKLTANFAKAILNL